MRVALCSRPTALVTLVSFLAFVCVRQPASRVEGYQFFKKASTAASATTPEATTNSPSKVIVHENSPRQQQQSSVIEPTNALASLAAAAAAAASSSPTGAGAEQANSGAKEALAGYSTSIASLLGAIQDSSFKYFNIEADQCRNRASCDFGYMLYKRLGFIHNWLLRTSVRHMVDPSNVYAQAWIEGMLGRNCSTIHTSCQQSPLDSLMGLALLQRFAM